MTFALNSYKCKNIALVIKMQYIFKKMKIRAIHFSDLTNITERKHSFNTVKSNMMPIILELAFKFCFEKIKEPYGDGSC